MENFFRRIEARVRATTKAFRVITVVPYSKGMFNQRWMERVGKMKAQDGRPVHVQELFVVQKNAFRFWLADFWQTGVFFKGSAPWPVGILMVENQAARDKYPLYMPALMELNDILVAASGKEPEARLVAMDANLKLRWLAMQKLPQRLRTNWRRMGEDLVRIVQQRLWERVDYTQEYSNFCRLAAEVGIIDEQTEEEIGDMLGPVRSFFMEVVKDRCNRLGLSHRETSSPEKHRLVMVGWKQPAKPSTAPPPSGGVSSPG